MRGAGRRYDTRPDMSYRGLGASLRSERGLTLVEMTVVVAIIAVIASMALPNVRGLIFDGRGTGKAADLREMTIGVARHLQEFRTFPTSSGELPPVSVRDFDHDGTVRLVIDTAAPDGDGVLPGNIDVTCTTATTVFADAVARCFLPVDFIKLRSINFNRPQHASDDVTTEDEEIPSFDSDLATVDFSASLIGRSLDDIEIFVADNGGSGTPFPTGALLVWNLTADAVPVALKSDRAYGRN